MNQFPWLTVLVAVPFVGALLVAFAPKARGTLLPKQLALGVSLLTLLVGVLVAAQFDTGGGMQLTEDREWIPALGVHYALGVDGTLTGGPVAIGAVAGQVRRVQNGFVRSYALSLLGGVLIVVLALLAVNLA